MANLLRAASTWRGSAGSPSGGGTNPNCAHMKALAHLEFNGARSAVSSEAAADSRN